MPSLALCALLVLSADKPTVVNVSDLPTLADLEARGYSLNELLGGSGSESRASVLYRTNTAYKSFADTLGQHLPHDANTDQLPDVIPPNSGDVPDMVRTLRGFEDKGARSDKDTKGGFLIRRLANNSQYPYFVEQNGDEPRHFDERWLWSEFALFKLVAVVNRMDRVDITKDSCGEVRFIYRLAYRSKASASSLPFFISVVEQYPEQPSCAEFAKRWQQGDVRMALQKLTFRQLELNFQALRFTSGYMQDFGGQAMYMQRIFRKEGQGLVSIPMENTPNVAALMGDPNLREDLAAYLRRTDNMQALDDGVLDLDARFLTKQSFSWSTLGRAREANRPFAQLFHAHPELLANLDVGKMKHVKTADGFVERLDNLTCAGCHQAGGTAGFHTLGNADPSFSNSFNRQQVAFSPFGFAEEARRRAWVDSLALGKKPNTFRPHSTLSAADWSTTAPTFQPLKVGQLCLATDDLAPRIPCGNAPGRATECRKTVNGPHVMLGECISMTPSAGNACWQGTLHEERKDMFAFTDKWTLDGPILASREPYSCVSPQSGAPLGRLSRRCTMAEENFEVDFAAGAPRELCANQGGQGFDMCAASGDSGACLETKIARAMLDACSPNRPCREDYICQAFPAYHKISKANYVRKKIRTGRCAQSRRQPRRGPGELRHQLYVTR